MLRIENLSKSFGDQTIANNITMNVPGGAKVALVGPNGAGKTTLLNIICGLDEADSGSVILPKGSIIGYLPQEPNQAPLASVLEECLSGDERLYPLKSRIAEVVEQLGDSHDSPLLKEYENLETEYRTKGGYGFEAEAQSILAGLGFTNNQMAQSPLALSGGWRMRLELARIFLKKPDVLVLDEPTNHLDLPSLVFVEAWLKRYPGTLLFVSHDRSLLNRLAKKTLHLETGQMALYHRGFDDFLEQRAAREATEAQAKAKLASRIEEHEKFVTRFGAKATKAKQAQSRVKMIEKLRALEEQIPEKAQGPQMHLKLPDVVQSGKDVLRSDGLSIGYTKDRILCSGLDFLVERGSRVAIIGANGIGKSTLLKTLANELPPIKGNFTKGHKVDLGYFAQDQATVLDLDATLIDNVMAAAQGVGQSEARKILGSFLFSGDSVFKESAVLSGGEKNRLGMACLLVKSCNFLLLDEPTNHLDMASVEVLIDALLDYKGTTMFVSHNREFIDALATHVLVMLPDGRARIFIGGLDDYRRLSAQTDFPDVLSAEPTVTEVPSEAKASAPVQQSTHHLSKEEVKEVRQKKRKFENKLTKLEKEQDQLTLTISQKEDEMGRTAPSDFTKLNNLAEEVEAARSRLAINEEEWLEASEAVEECNAQLAAMGRL